MAGSLNRVMLIGHAGKDSEVRSLNNGGRVVSFSLATSETWNDKATGERKEKTEWHQIVIFNEQLGSVAEKFVRKGTQVFLEGQIQTRKWQDQSGVDKYTTEIVLGPFKSTLTLLGSRDDAEPAQRSISNARPNSTRPQTAYGNPRPAGGGRPSWDSQQPRGRNDDLSDDIPF